MTEADYKDWLEGLPAKMQATVKKDEDEFEKSKGMLGLRGHTLERRNIGYAAFMQDILSPEDWHTNKK